MSARTIGVTGPRELTAEQALTVMRDLEQVLNTETRLHVGCARGVDALARAAAHGTPVWGLQVWRAEGREPWQLQQRSKWMVDSVAAADGTLHAWVNKPCPKGLTAESWKGSGTWGTVAYAHSLGVKIELHWLIPATELPYWMTASQMDLLEPQIKQSCNAGIDESRVLFRRNPALRG